MKWLSRYLVPFALVMSMCGCSTPPLRGMKPFYQGFQENLLTECPQDLPRLAGNTGSDFDQALRAYSSRYVECAARHNELINNIRQRESEWLTK